MLIFLTIKENGANYKKCIKIEMDWYNNNREVINIIGNEKYSNAYSEFSEPFDHSLLLFYLLRVAFVQKPKNLSFVFKRDLNRLILNSLILTYKLQHEL